MLDTLLRRLIDELVTGSNTAGTYFINNSSTTADNQSLVSSTLALCDKTIGQQRTRNW